MKHLKSFNENLNTNLTIDTNIIMDVLNQLKDDDKYNIDVTLIPSDIDSIFEESIKLLIKVYGLKDEFESDCLNHIHKVIHQMLNYYYSETGKDIYLIQYDDEQTVSIDIDDWQVSNEFIFRLNPIEDIQRHVRYRLYKGNSYDKLFIMTQDELAPESLSPLEIYHKYSKKYKSKMF